MCFCGAVCTDKAVVHPEEGHLAGLVEQVGEGDEGVGRVQVEDQHCRDERHALHLNTDITRSPVNTHTCGMHKVPTQT